MQVQMRYGCNIRLRNALCHWSRVSLQHDERSRQQYHRLRRSGHSHGRALRGVADRLLAVLIAMLRQQTRYDPQRRQRIPDTLYLVVFLRERKLGAGQDHVQISITPRPEKHCLHSCGSLMCRTLQARSLTGIERPTPLIPAPGSGYDIRTCLIRGPH
jgi:hypothetical protein